MIGHIPLVRMRKTGKRPKSVWIYLGIDQSKWAATWHLYSDLWVHPWICIEPKDKIGLLDLRFAVGLQVHITGDEYPRLLEAHLAFLKAGAKDVFTLAGGELIHDGVQNASTA